MAVVYIGARPEPDSRVMKHEVERSTNSQLAGNVEPESDHGLQVIAVLKMNDKYLGFNDTPP